MAGDHDTPAGEKIPVLLLKTKSSPTDAYEEYFSAANEGLEYVPVFVPVLEHKFLDVGMDQVRTVLQSGKVGMGSDCAYGGLIFTSQRAVEAFAQLVTEGPGAGAGTGEEWPCLQDVPVYGVGPATTRALRAVRQEPGLQVFGEHTGNGDALAQFILEHYGEWYRDRPTKPPLLFLVGEKRRDIIPKTLMDANLPDGARTQVDEVVVYGTGVKPSFEKDVLDTLDGVSAHPGNSADMRWVVVFSPVDCGGLLRDLGLVVGDAKAAAKSGGPGRATFVATIGPTTKAFLEESLGFTPDVCSEQPSPEGLRDGITKYIKGMR